MARGAGNATRASNDARSNSLNPNNAAFHASEANRAIQLSSPHADAQASQSESPERPESRRHPAEARRRSSTAQPGLRQVGPARVRMPAAGRSPFRRHGSGP